MNDATALEVLKQRINDCDDDAWRYVDSAAQRTLDALKAANVIPTWIACSDRLPDVAEDYWGAFTHSIEVLATDGKRHWVAYLMRWPEDDAREPEWKVQGPDGYTLDDITHWQPLPELP